MAENTKIEWTDHTVNLWWGCTKVNAGCDNCYAEHLSDTRYKNNLWGEGVPRKAIKSALLTLSKLQAKAADRGVVETVFISSMSDIFEKSKPLINHKGEKLGLTTGDLRNELFFNISKGCYPNLIFLFLTKRPSNINKMVPAVWLFNPPDNVVFGASVSDQQSANDVARHFKGVPGKKFLSVEPMLEKVDLSPFVGVSIKGNKVGKKMLVDWVIVGGESGHNKRPFDPNWARIIKGFCSVTKTPFFMKQWDKVQPIPEDLMVRQFPEYLIDAKPPNFKEIIKGRIQQLRDDEPELFSKLASLNPFYVQRLPGKPQNEQADGWFCEALSNYLESGDSLTAEEVLAKLKEIY